MCVCVCVCVCVSEKDENRADGMKEKSAHCPRVCVWGGGIFRERTIIFGLIVHFCFPGQSSQRSQTTEVEAITRERNSQPERSLVGPSFLLSNKAFFISFFFILRLISLLEGFTLFADR